MFTHMSSYITEKDELEIRVYGKENNRASITFTAQDHVNMTASFTIDRCRIPELIQKLLLVAPPNETEGIRLHKHVLISDGDIGADDVAINQRLRNHGIVGGANE